MSEHLGAPGDTFDRAIELRLVGDFAEQGRRIRELGPAVLRDGRLHLVLDLSGLEADSDIIRHELARLLIRRAGWRLPPAIEDGAALWLAQTGQPDSAATVWYGRSWRQWLPELVAMDVLPSTDELLMTERPYDGSRVLWTPVAAAVVDALEGETLARKLDPMPSPKAGRDLVAGVLRELETSANQQTPSRSHPAVRRAGRSSGGFQNGVAFAMANGVDTGYHAPSAERRLDLLRGLGVDSVSVMPFAYQRNPEKPAMAFLNRHPASETDVGVIHAARQAKKRGMTVMWKPHLWIGHHSWPGDVTMGSEADWSTWFHVYRRYVVHHAVLAEHAGADWFAIGVELGQTVHRETEWRHLIGSVRRVYSGHLTYAGNWWGDYDKVPFWDALDAVGIDAYFPLSDDEDADLATLRRGARNVVSQLQAAAERWDRPVLLTEVGFAARRSPWASPHEEGGTVSEVDQRLAWQVLLSELGKPSWLLGLHAWKVFTHPRGEGLGKPDFRFVGRPAQQVLEAYFRTEPGVVSVDLTGR
ncbi:MAG: hypothetical protein MPN21_20725 [Thermoanaerobaculia bacterium]|nr:hypothetical protein [Thermoanaerobaculia bacterium]